MAQQENNPSISSNDHEFDPDKATKSKKIIDDCLPRSSPTRKETISKIVETDEVVRLLDEIINDCPPGDYWRTLAEKKRSELEEALVENERLFKIKISLLQQNSYYKMVLEEANSFVTGFKEVADEDADDTGIDMANEDNYSI